MPFLPFVYGYPSCSPRAHCTPKKIVPTLHYTCRPGPRYTGHACRHFPSAVPWISEDRLLFHMHNNGVNFWDETECIIIWPSPTKHMLKNILLMETQTYQLYENSCVCTALAVHTSYILVPVSYYMAAHTGDWLTRKLKGTTIQHRYNSSIKTTTDTSMQCDTE